MPKTEDIIKLKKPALNVPIIDILEKRFSPRNLIGNKINEKEIESFFEAARWAPSARNIQPWFFYFAHRDSQGFNKLVSCFYERNNWGENAPLLILACYIKNDLQPDEKLWSVYDLNASVFSLIIQAQSMGYYARQIGSFDHEKTKKMFNLQNHEPFIIIALGKLGDYINVTRDIIDRDLQKRERKTEIAKELI